MTARALELLDADAATEVVVVVAKSGDATRFARSGGKPVVAAATLEEAAAAAAAHVGARLPEERVEPPAPTPGALRGLFSGGTLAAEARAVAPAGTHVDLGDDEFTDGRAHPIVDLRLRLERLRAEAADPAVGVLLLDVVLGRAAHPDPAAELAAPVAEALARRGGRLSVVVALCGAAGDPQGLERQAALLRDSGAVVVRGTARAARLAAGAAA
jgi:FdrA protein